MTEEKTDRPSGTEGTSGAEGGSEDGGDASGRGGRDRVGDGIKQGLGVLSAFRDAVEETIQEARERGGLSTDRAREVVREALDKAQAASEKARGRLDFATHSEIEDLRRRVARLEEAAFGAAEDAQAEPRAEGTDPAAGPPGAGDPGGGEGRSGRAPAGESPGA